MVYSQPGTQAKLLVRLGDHMGCWGSIPNWQAHYLLYYLSGTIIYLLSRLILFVLKKVNQTIKFSIQRHTNKWKDKETLCSSLSGYSWVYLKKSRTLLTNSTDSTRKETYSLKTFHEEPIIMSSSHQVKTSLHQEAKDAAAIGWPSTWLCLMWERRPGSCQKEMIRNVVWQAGVELIASTSPREMHTAFGECLNINFSQH